MSTYGVIDNLTYTYNGNQLTKVTDAANGPNYTGAFHFVDGSNATTEYEYDQNGNMTKDLNKKISRIQYNLLNLPSTIKIMNATGTYFINKTYDATGQLLRVRYQFGTGGTGPLGSIGDSFPDGGNEPQGGGLVGPIQPPVFDDGRKDYCGNIIYENNALSQILFDGGYITLSGTTPTYHYYLQDYLGNNRVVVKQDGTVEQVNHYYPFGSIIPDICSDQDIQPYKYNGKELDLMHGLNTYDYGARQYNPVTAHWDRVDPLCEKYYSLSPYAYCANNPIRFIDPDGRSMGDFYNTSGKYIGTDGLDDGKKYMVLDSDEQKLVKEQETTSINNLSSAISVPSNKVVNAMETAFEKTEETDKEYGFRVGVNGTVTSFAEGTENDVSNWDVPIAELKGKREYVAYDVHTHPMGDSYNYGLAMPSTWDIQNVITSGGQPCVVLGYSEKQPFFNPNMIGGATAPQLERSIGFYNSGGLISKPMSFNQFKRAVKKINKE